MVPLIVSFLQIRCIFQKRTPASPILFGPTGLCPLVVPVIVAGPINVWVDKEETCLLFDVLELGFLDHSPPTSFTVNTSHQVGKARCLDAMQTLKKGASFFSEPWRRCFNCLFFHFFCLGYVTCHVDGVFLWFRIIIKFTLSWLKMKPKVVPLFVSEGLESKVQCQQTTKCFVKSEWSKHLLLHLRDRV